MGNTKKWTQKNGKKIRIKDMSDQHLINTIKMLERRLEEAKRNMPYPMFNGDMAQWFAEQDYDAFQKSVVSDHVPIYDDLIEEKIMRGL